MSAYTARARDPNSVSKFNSVKSDPCSLVSQLSWKNVTCRGCGTRVPQDSDRRDFGNWERHRASCDKLRGDVRVWAHPPPSA
ncbi:hypothetical protein K435DRAFT_781370 [Dendrothele bispora CBS 962.96]|uniref:Uncharacterized protein n=1 Tax=Dendrothele bispora (strain CBS 962.96) TaxID=1314807 RepID=A0A4S8LL96_DENBC|nr:hypothetical protein K435DRAFT_781370 [Dendrothele bispora CBS 962.96]